MHNLVKYQLLPQSGQNLVAFLLFLFSCCGILAIYTSSWWSLLEGQEVSQLCFPRCLRAQLVPDWWHLSAQSCRLLHPSVLETPTCSVKAAGTARFPRVRATNQIIISFTCLTQAVSPQRQSFLREHFPSDKTHKATIFVKRLHLTFGQEKI